MATCLFDEPFVGQCTESCNTYEVVCDKHAKEKCQVCGVQALTRCQASGGVMCGIPLCQHCGAAEMCLYHATSGPLMVIKALLGGGPIPGSFACRKEIIDNGNEMIAAVERVRKLKLKPTMDEFLKAKADWEAQAKPMPKQPYQP